MGPVTECGPPPGLARRSLTMSSIVEPGWMALWACIMVSTATLSPELTVTLGGSCGSSQPHCVVSSVAGRTWYLPPPTTTLRSRLASSLGGSWDACGAIPQPPRCVRGPAGAGSHPELVLPPGTEIVSRGMDPHADAYSCFDAEAGDGLPFAAALGERGVSRLFVGGLATDYCVRATVVDGVQAGFEMVVLEDAVAAPDLAPRDGAKAPEEMRAAGAQLVPPAHPPEYAAPRA